MNSNLFTAKKAELGIEFLRERESEDLEGCNTKKLHKFF